MRTVSFDSLLKSGEYRSVPSVISIGVFDGVHNGHRAILEALMRMKKEKKAAVAAVITFSVNPKGENAQLDTLRLREEYMASSGVDVLVVIDFSPVFSKITACEFIALLKRAFSVRGAAVGEDFRFGNPASQGDGRDLERLLRKDGVDCTVQIVDSVNDSEGMRISSTRLRQMIIKGDLGCIPQLSGQFYRVDLVPLPYRSGSGELIYSRESIHQLLPPPGAYDAALSSIDGKKHSCIAEIGDNALRILPLDAGLCGKDDLLPDSLYLEKRR